MKIWKETKYEYYVVSNEGDVFNTKTETLLKLTPESNGYYKVTLSVKGVIVESEVHRLIAETFIERDESLKLVVDHIDGNPLNNHVDNLQWITQKKRIWQKRKINVAGIDSPKKRKHKLLMRKYWKVLIHWDYILLQSTMETEILHDIVTQELSKQA
jgi:hypothetical protein